MSINDKTTLVAAAELETSDYDQFVDVKYQGQPFTGKAYERTANFYSEYSYSNGFGHGKCFTTYTNGNKMEEFELLHGEQIGDAYTWFENGQMKEWNNDSFVKNWSESGILIRYGNFIDDEKWEYYYTGELMKKSVGDKIQYFTKSAEIFALYENKETRFYDTIIEQWFDSVYEEESFYSIIAIYISDLLKDDKARSTLVLRKMLDQNNLNVQSLAINLIGNLNIIEFKEALKQKLAVHKIPPPQYGRHYDSGGSSSSLTYLKMHKKH